jgi:prevent-host-death family protein
MHWQVQEAKQRFSELLRAVESEGVQYVTKHGKEIAVVVSIDEFHRLASSETRKSFAEHILGFPKLGIPNDEIDALFARQTSEPESQRKTPFVGPEWE